MDLRMFYYIFYDRIILHIYSVDPLHNGDVGRRPATFFFLETLLYFNFCFYKADSCFS